MLGYMLASFHDIHIWSHECRKLKQSYLKSIYNFSLVFLGFLDPWTWGHYDPSKCSQSITLLLCVTTQKTWILNTDAIETSDPTVVWLTFVQTRLLAGHISITIAWSELTFLFAEIHELKVVSKTVNKDLIFPLCISHEQSNISILMSQ